MENRVFKKIVLACSGASNTGAYSDSVSRKLMKEGKAKMLCLARFAVDEKFIEITKDEITNYDDVIVIDGCPVNCSEKIIAKLNIDNYKHVNITDFGIKKGITQLTEDRVFDIAKQIIE